MKPSIHRLKSPLTSPDIGTVFDAFKMLYVVLADAFSLCHFPSPFFLPSSQPCLPPPPFHFIGCDGMCDAVHRHLLCH